MDYAHVILEPKTGVATWRQVAADRGDGDAEQLFRKAADERFEPFAPGLQLAAWAGLEDVLRRSTKSEIGLDPVRDAVRLAEILARVSIRVSLPGPSAALLWVCSPAGGSLVEALLSGADRRTDRDVLDEFRDLVTPILHHATLGLALHSLAAFVAAGLDGSATSENPGVRPHGGRKMAWWRRRHERHASHRPSSFELPALRSLPIVLRYVFPEPVWSDDWPLMEWTARRVHGAFLAEALGGRP